MEQTHCDTPDTPEAYHCITEEQCDKCFLVDNLYAHQFEWTLEPAEDGTAYEVCTLDDCNFIRVGEIIRKVEN